MLKSLLAALTLAGSSFSSVVTAQENQLNVAVASDEVGTVQAEVVLATLARPASSAQVRLPSSWGGDDDLASSLVSLPPSNTSGTPESIAFRATIRHSRFDQAVSALQPISGKNWIFFFGQAALPTFAEERGEYDLSLSAPKMEIVSNIGIFDSSVDHSFTSAREARDTYFLIGPQIETVKADVDGVELTINYVDELDFDILAKELIERYRFILGRFNKGRPQAFNIVLVPMPPMSGEPFFQGTAVPGGMAIHTSDPDPQLWQHQLTHELVHEWLPLRMGGIDASRGGEERYAFSEGYTEYVSNLFGLKLGTQSYRDFLEKLNAAYLAASFGRIDGQINPYELGLIQAFLLDFRLYEAKRPSLMNLLSGLTAPDVNGGHSEGDAYTRFVAALRRFDMEPPAPGEIGTVPGSLSLGRFCIASSVADGFRYELGFDFDFMEDGRYRVRDVNPGSRAYEAGLRDGMVINERVAGDKNDKESLAVFSVDASGESKEIAFYPKSHRSVPVPHFEFTGTQETEEACKDRLLSSFGR